jgi:uncharacterized membrane protein
MTVLHSLSLWLHILSMVLWLGAIVFFLAAFGPAVRGLPPERAIPVLDRGRRSFEALSWVAITLLVVSGIASLIFHGQSFGFSRGQFYFTVLSVKLLLFTAMFFHHSLQVFKYAPLIVTSTSQITAGSADWPEPLRSYWTKWFVLLKINAALGAIVPLLGWGLVQG